MKRFIQIIVFVFCCLTCRVAMAQYTITYEYDELNRLVKVDYPNGQRVEYAYDALGNRISRTVSQLGVIQTITLSAGWNWISVYVEGDAVALIQALENGLGDKGITIKDSDISTDYYGEDFGWFGELDALGIVNEQMYMINVSEICTVELQGTPANPANHTITINPGWNWIGFPCAEAVSVAVALGGFEAVEGDVLKSNETSTDYYGEDFGWFGELQTLEPGQGYLYKYNGTQPKTLIFSTTAKGKSVFSGKRME